MRAIVLFSFLLITSFARSQSGYVVWDSLRSEAIALGVTRQNPVRRFAVYLPPGYTSSTKQYPVLYLLHGVGDGPEIFVSDTTRYASIQDLMNMGVAKNMFGEMIIVMPDEQTDWFGSFYVNSAATGNWEDFTVQELVRYVDNRYRTLPKPAARAIAGHSMGGYGAITLAMKHPDIFRVAYGMNAALFCFCGELTPAHAGFKKFIQATSMETLLAEQDYVAVGLLNLARAISPNPKKPPLYLDKPFSMNGTTLVPNESVYALWEKQNAVNLAGRYQDNLRKLKALKFDSGNNDDSQFIVDNNRQLSQRLKALKVPHVFEEYNGDHSNTLWGPRGRIYTSLLPFLSENLAKQ